MNQRGFVLPALGITAYAAIAASVVIFGMGVALKVESSRLASCKQEFEGFKAQVKALGDVAAAKSKAETDRQAKLLKDTEATSAKLKSDLSIANKRLRNERASRSRVPAAPPTSSRPDLACFDRSLLADALRQLDEGVSGLVDEGSENTLRLKMSVDWAASALKPSQ